MSGAIRFFGITTLVVAVGYVAVILMSGNLDLVNQLVAVGVLFAGVFWAVVLLAFANVYDWMSRLADHFDVREPE